ncbi:N-acetylmuramoyl-L-alanine amidase [Bradyrhizobium sp. U87765 SZCCT0131]|uniref:N-acetylmuramoyl-L-alanine amidase n=1 Tax=unclassified Bradyrhizobium TaxID=2631580 RepID=UPI001BA64723|nr:MULTISPECIES: N-acetylmuramoyl-L-alanine amidase [unclassified Bradyrhizobium]MBR1218396.1 N-acetylmuramoyl-L-alanine amidase [Bradyrhizobium sp. U87765 SZCCT0131]MBR1260658.1 N-acetylmuramoyl-L-alanine amidase [Bradyrhizobium sp. U87765 SZCCT0134]MBR1303894.1 N-acetylmuramoyl-L-alanine amidase [Bradyrhizobium sp. U87765 SZCCT0110]MBR1319500.1 N-acetylmuramoyl-L-alanine amidase [Bradyrhizobium sp. U87765 SZCCT0109]MBR1347825.1 N-acetylmuramoyl-L-alanine amidase [Bradyrhizobium sp. U87765 SZ
MIQGSFASGGSASKRQRILPSTPPSRLPSPWVHADMLKFMPDSSVISDVVPSANYGDRRNNRAPDMIVLHYTGMQDAESALARLCKPGTEVSAHYVVLEDGRIVQCVPEAYRAWHAGTSSWAGETDINSCSIGVEIVNGGHDWGYPDFPSRQVAAVIALCRGIIIRRDIPSDRVLGHSDIAPDRKKDPGEKFPWRLLASSGVGHWVRPARIVPGGPALRPGMSGDTVLALQERLAAYGYAVPRTGQYDAPTTAVIMAFQRHFRPELVDGIADLSTLETLQQLLDTKPPERPHLTPLPPHSMT